MNKQFEKSSASEYSFNIESELFQQLSLEQQRLWKKEIEQAYNAGMEEMRGKIVEDNMLLPFKEYDSLMDSINKRKKEGYEAGYKKGLENSKEYSMPCTLGWYDGYIPEFTSEQLHEIVEKQGLNVGDKIKVIVVKDENN